jgi:group I intron endonuclease
MTELFNGIYQIRNLVNGKRYVGSAAGADGFPGRWKAHRNALNRGDHDNKHLQRAWNKYGEDSFVFEAILICSPEDCISYEQLQLDTELFEYNMCPIAGSSRGRRHSDETKEKIKNAHQGLKHSSATKSKMSEVKKHGRAPGAKLNSEKVRQIRRMINDRVPSIDIAVFFDVSESTIANIKAGRRWGYVV